MWRNTKKEKMFLPMGMWFTIVIFLLGIPGDHCAKIIGGKVSAPHSRPFMAMIRGSIEFCGGTLVKQNWVLTAAHCKIQYGDDVILGVNSARDMPKQVFKVFNIVRPKNYNIGTKEKDIMLLQLNNQAQLNKNVAIVNLPLMYRDPLPGTQCLVAGWGITEFGKKKPSPVLREVNVTVIARGICNDQNHYNSKLKVTKNMVCAGGLGGGNDACIGDSGGPLICNGVQRGIVSFGRGCGNPHYPGVYTLLTNEYLHFIKSVINGN